MIFNHTKLSRSYLWEDGVRRWGLTYRRRVIRAYRAGWVAGRHGADWRTNPYYNTSNFGATLAAAFAIGRDLNLAVYR